MSLGQRIRHLRQSRGLTQAQLGGAEVTKSFISLLERDRTQPSVETLALIARRLGTSVDSLLGQHGNIPEMVSEGILTLSRSEIRNRNLNRAAQFVDAVLMLSKAYGLEEAAREAQLQHAEIEMEHGRLSEAWAVLEGTRRIAEQARDFWRLGRALLVMGTVKMRQRDIPQAIALLQQSLLVLRRARASRDPARVEALISLGSALGYMGDYRGAIQRYEEAARSDVARHDRILRGQALWGVGQAYRKMGNHGVALEYLLKAKDALESAEELPDLVRVLKAIGQLYLDQGNKKEALRYLHRSLRAAGRLGMHRLHASALTELGRVHLSLGRLDEAQQFAGQALVEAREVDDPLEVAEASTVLARVHVTQHAVAKAIPLFQDALSIFQERKMQENVAEVARELGLLLRDQGAHAQAAAYLALSLDSAKQESSSGDPVVAWSDS